ncbi:MAG: hypothetical protein HY231_18010 [Acidobacteria bacterium]|nr:hypothetical protein [Acidobacteriota bacterium]
MKKLILMALLTTLLLACSNSKTPKQEARDAEPYRVISSLVNPANHSLLVMIQVDPPLNEARVKKAVELVIENNKGQFQNIEVKSFATPDANTPPFATSDFDGQSVSHRFNPQAAPQKIPSH